MLMSVFGAFVKKIKKQIYIEKSRCLKNNYYLWLIHLWIYNFQYV